MTTKTIQPKNKKSLLGKVKDKGMEIIGNIGKVFVEDIFKTPQKMEKELTKQLDEYFSGISPKQLEEAFENNMNIAPQIAEMTLYYKSLAEQYNIDLSSIKHNIEVNSRFFDKDWLMKYLKNEQEEFYNRIMVHPTPETFKNWISGQIQLIYKTIISNL